MKITFFTNFLNHHQLPFCLELHNNPNINFTLVATERIPHDRLQLGYEDMNNKYPFVLTSYDSKLNYKHSIELAKNSDVIIWGSAPYEYMKYATKNKRIVFRYSERILKNGIKEALNPLRFVRNVYRFRILERNAYLLAASAYATRDYNLFLGYKERSYKWGYFPEVKKNSTNKIVSLKKKNIVPNLIWVGRFIDWKNPELAINLASDLKKKGYKFHLTMIGGGDLESKIHSMIDNLSLNEYISLPGTMSPNEVRNYMDKSDIFLFTSDFGEGWGAVLNEAMNSACAVVVSHAVGAAPFLINEYNGLMYDNSNPIDFLEKVEHLINNDEIRVNMGVNAYQTLVNEWNAKVAANRFLKVCDSLSNNKLEFYETGPLSIAKSISENKGKW